MQLPDENVHTDNNFITEDSTVVFKYDDEEEDYSREIEEEKKEEEEDNLSVQNDLIIAEQIADMWYQEEDKDGNISKPNERWCRILLEKKGAFFPSRPPPPL